MLKKISSALLAGFLLVGSSYAYGDFQTVLPDVQQAIADLKAVGGGAQYDNLTPKQKKQAIGMMLGTKSDGSLDQAKVDAIETALADVDVSSETSIASAISVEVSTSFAPETSSSAAPTGNTGSSSGSNTGSSSSSNTGSSSSSNTGSSSSSNTGSNTGSNAGGGTSDAGFGGGTTGGGGNVDLATTLTTNETNQTVRSVPEVVREIVEAAGGSASLG